MTAYNLFSNSTSNIFFSEFVISTSQSKYNCIISLGAVIKGETDHYHYISEAVTNGIMSITLEDKLPNVLFGVLTCQNKELALARSGDNLNQNKGYEVGLAAASRLKP